MIRRNPTLIPMSDSDVQDIRDIVARQKAEAYALQQAILRMKKIAEKPLDEEDIQMLLQLKNTTTAREKEMRLGIQPGEGPLPSGSS